MPPNWYQEEHLVSYLQVLVRRTECVHKGHVSTCIAVTVFQASAWNMALAIQIQAPRQCLFSLFVFGPLYLISFAWLYEHRRQALQKPESEIACQQTLHKIWK